MKILFFYIGTPTPILETELELIRKHEKLGDEVTVFQCTGKLSNCYWNIKHKESNCLQCRSKFQKGWEVLNPGNNVSLRECLPENSQKKPNLMMDFNSVSEISAFKYDGEKIGLGVTSSIVSLTRDHRFNTQKYQNRINKTLQSSIEVYDFLKKQIKDIKPDIVYFFNGRIHTHLPVRLLCEKFGLEYYSYEVSLQKNHFVLLKNKTVHHSVSIDRVAALQNSWTVAKQLEGEKILQRMRSGDPDGNHWTFLKNQKKNILPKKFNKYKRNIAIFCGTLDEYEGIEWGTNKIYHPDQTKGIECILEEFENNHDFFFYVRVHPNMADLPRRTSQLADIQKINLRFKNALVIWPEEKVDTYALMEVCEKVVTFGSTIGVEATFWGRPSILADHSLFEHFGYAHCPESHKELIKLLECELEPKPKSTAIQAIYDITFTDSVPFESFKEQGRVNSQSYGLFDGVNIRAQLPLRLWVQLNNISDRLKRVFFKPTFAIRKIKYRWK